MLALEKNPSFAHRLGLGLGLGLVVCCLSEIVVSRSLGIVVQKALLQPVPIFQLGARARIKEIPPLFYLYREMRKKIAEGVLFLKDQRLTLKTKRVQD